MTKNKVFFTADIFNAWNDVYTCYYGPAKDEEEAEEMIEEYIRQANEALGGQWYVLEDVYYTQLG